MCVSCKHTTQFTFILHCHDPLSINTSHIPALILIPLTLTSLHRTSTFTYLHCHLPCPAPNPKPDPNNPPSTLASCSSSTHSISITTAFSPNTNWRHIFKTMASPHRGYINCWQPPMPTATATSISQSFEESVCTSRQMAAASRKCPTCGQNLSTSRLAINLHKNWQRPKPQSAKPSHPFKAIFADLQSELAIPPFPIKFTAQDVGVPLPMRIDWERNVWTVAALCPCLAS